MAESTAIAWTDHTFNPWQGCVKVSPACDHCYAESLSIRTGHGDRWGADGERTVTSDAYWRNPVKWDRAAEQAGRQARVFCGSMCDVFEDRADLDDARGRLWVLIEQTPHLIWQLLTKRPENVLDAVPPRWRYESWPSNVWIGTTVEDQERADERIPHLLEIPAPVRFLSCEPLLGSIDLRPEWVTLELQAFGPGGAVLFPRIGWLIVGGESGAGWRPMDLDQARKLRDVCAEHDIPFFFKQHSAMHPKALGHLLDGVEHHAFPTMETVA